jgi:hypothetical protein
MTPTELGQFNYLIMQIQALNAFNFTIKHDSIIAMPDDNDKIHSLSLNGETVITIGDRVFIDESGWHLVNIIEKNNDRYRCLTSKRNNSSILVAPLFMRSRDLMLWSQGLINCFLWNEEHDDDSLFWMLYKYPNSGLDREKIRFDSMRKRFDGDSLYQGEINYKDLYIMFAFKRPDEENIAFDIRAIENSRYSSISDASKKKIYEFHNIRQTGSTLQQELEKAPQLKKKLEDIIGDRIPDNYELRSSITPELETFRKCVYQI